MLCKTKAEAQYHSTRFEVTEYFNLNTIQRLLWGEF